MNIPVFEKSPAAAQRRYSAKRTRHHVNLFCDAPGAQQVSVAGDFNGWDASANPMRRMPDGRWLTGLELPHGHHRYVFLVDGAPTLDPNASVVTTGDPNETVSIVAVS